MEYQHIHHTFKPIYNEGSKILILGSFPSVKSREAEFFYGHPQNRFWKVLAAVFNESVPTSVDEKKKLLLKNRIAVWDVIHSCEIVGSSDSSISNVAVNDISMILNQSNVDKIFVNGKKAFELYNKYIKPNIEIEAVCLPSTSPANAAYKLDRLIDEWSVINEQA